MQCQHLRVTGMVGWNRFCACPQNEVVRFHLRQPVVGEWVEAICRRHDKIYEDFNQWAGLCRSRGSTRPSQAVVGDSR